MSEGPLYLFTTHSNSVKQYQAKEEHEEEEDGWGAGSEKEQHMGQVSSS